MATLLLNTSDISPILLFVSNLFTFHNPNGINARLLKEALHSHYMIGFAISYNERKSAWLSITDITALNESDLIETLTIHCYDANLLEKHI